MGGCSVDRRRAAVWSGSVRHELEVAVLHRHGGGAAQVAREVVERRGAVLLAGDGIIGRGKPLLQAGGGDHQPAQHGRADRERDQTFRQGHRGKPPMATKHRILPDVGAPVHMPRDAHVHAQRGGGQQPGVIGHHRARRPRRGAGGSATAPPAGIGVIVRSSVKPGSIEAETGAVLRSGQKRGGGGEIAPARAAQRLDALLQAERRGLRALLILQELERIRVEQKQRGAREGHHRDGEHHVHESSSQRREPAGTGRRASGAEKRAFAFERAGNAPGTGGAFWGRPCDLPLRRVWAGRGGHASHSSHASHASHSAACGHEKARSCLAAKPGLLFPRLLVEGEGGETGNVLLSHTLSAHYHRGCSVSLPCSEWERVGPLR